MLLQGLELGSEHERPAELSVVQRLLADPVGKQMQPALGPIEEREGEHAVELLQRSLDAPRLEGRQHDFGVRMPTKDDAGLRVNELLANSYVVVDLTVVRDHVACRGGSHRLTAR